MSVLLEVESSITVGEFAAFVLWKEPESKIVLGIAKDIFLFENDRDKYEYELRYVTTNELLSHPRFCEPVCNCDRARVYSSALTWRYHPKLPLIHNEDAHKLKNWFIDIIFPKNPQIKPQVPFENIPCNWNLADAYFQWLLKTRMGIEFRIVDGEAIQIVKPTALNSVHSHD